MGFKYRISGGLRVSEIGSRVGFGFQISGSEFRGLGSDVGDVAEIGALRAEQLPDDRESGVCVVQLDEHLPRNRSGSVSIRFSPIRFRIDSVLEQFI